MYGIIKGASNGSSQRMVGQVGFGALDWNRLSKCEYVVLFGWVGYVTATSFQFLFFFFFNLAFYKI